MTIADDDGIRRWREAGDAQTEQELQAREDRARVERRMRTDNARSDLRNSLRTEIESVRAEAEQRAEVHLEAVGEVVGTLRDEIGEELRRAVKDIETKHREMESELFRLIERRFAELAARLDLIGAPETRARKDFRFSSEKGSDDEATPLPNPVLLRGNGLN
jgi:hypothetical protein